MCSPDSTYYVSPCLDVASAAPLYCDNSIYYGNPRHDVMHSLVFVRNPPVVPSFVSSTMNTITATSATINMTLSNDGVVYCSAMTTVPSSILAVQISNFWSYSNNNKVSINITNLLGATEYSVYCFTQSLDQVSMSYTTMLSTGVIPFRTNCCKTFSISILNKLIKIGVPSVHAFSVTIDSLPQVPDYLILNFELYTSKGALVNAVFSPSVLNITRYHHHHHHHHHHYYLYYYYYYHHHHHYYLYYYYYYYHHHHYYY